MFKKIAYILLTFIALVLYVEFAAAVFFITFALTLGFRAIHINEIGSIFLIIINIVLLLKFLGKIQENVEKTTWEEFTSTNISYDISIPQKSYNAIINIIFTIEYELMGKRQHKQLMLTKNRIYRIKISEILDKKLKNGSLQALLYKKPRSEESEVLFQKTFSITNVLLVALLLPIHVGLLSGSLLLYDSIDKLDTITLTQAIKNLPQNDLGLVYIVSTILLLLYVVYLLRGIMRTGLRGFRNYPMLYDVQQGIKVDLLKSIVQLVDICTSCGEIIELREKYCSNCGQTIYKKKYYRVDEETEEEIEEDLTLLQ